MCPPSPATAGLTEAEAEEGAKAAAAAREQAGGSDDDGDDYRQASKVGGVALCALASMCGCRGAVVRDCTGRR